MARTVFNTNAEVKKVLRFTDTPCHHEKEQAEAYEHLHPSRWNIANNVNVCIVSILGIVALAVFIKWYYSSLIGMYCNFFIKVNSKLWCNNFIKLSCTLFVVVCCAFLV